MEFKKTVAGISAAAIAVTQVAAVIPMGAFAATTAVDSANVQFALNYKAGGTTKSVTAAADTQKATVDAADITSVEDFGLSFSGAITSADLADGDKYTFTANGLTVTAKEKDTKSIDKTGTVWVEADGVDLDGTTVAGKLDVENAGAVGDTVTITYTKGETDIKVVDSTGADITDTASEEGKFTFVLTAESASKFTVSGDGVTVSKVEVTAVTTDESDFATDKKKLETGGYEYTLNSKAVGDEVVITYEDDENFVESEENVKADVAVTGAADGTTDSDNKTYTFKLTSEMVEAGKFVVTGNGHVVTKVTVKHTATEDKTPTEGLAIKDTKTPATVTVAADKFTDVALAEGSALTVKTAKTGENNGTITIKAGDVVITEDTEPAESYTLTADQADAVKASGLTITGSGIKLCQVDYRVKGETTKGQTITLFSGSDSVVWSETYAAETQTWETLAEDTSKTTVSTTGLTLDTLEAFKGKYENITATWSELTAVKVTPDKPTVKTEEVDYPLYDASYDLSKTALKVGAFPFNTGDSVIVKLSSAITSKVQLYKADGATLIKEEKVVSNESDNTVTFKLSESEAAEITANGFVIKGTEGTVTQLSFDKSKELGSFTNNNAVPLSELKGKGVKKARVTLNVTKYDSNGYATFDIVTNCDSGYKVYRLATEKQYDNGAGQDWQANEKITKTGETSAVVELDLTGDELNFYDIELKTDNYDVLSGELVKVEFLDGENKVVTTYPAPVQPEKETVNGTLPFTSEEGVDLSAKKLQIAASEMAADGKITVTLKDNVTNEIALKSVAEGNAEIAKAAPAENAAEVVFTLTADQAAKAANGFIVEADAGVVTGVAYEAKKEEEPDPVDKSQTIKEIDNNKAPISKVSAATKAKITVNVTTLTDGKGVLSFYTNSAEGNGGGWKQVDYGTDAADTENKITATGEMTATVDFPITDKDQWYQIGVKTSDPDVINGELVKIEFVNADDETIYTYDPNEASIGKDNFTFSALKNEEMKVGDSFTVTYDSKNTPKNAKYVIKYKIHAPNDPDAWEGYIYPAVVDNGKIDNSSSAKTGLKVTSATEGTVTTFTFTAVSKTTVEPFGVNIEISSSGEWNDTQYPWFGDISFFVKSAADEDTTKIDINAANFPDANFRKVLTAYSSEKVKNVPVLTEADIAKITDLGNGKPGDAYKDEVANLAKVVNFKGIEKLTALKSLTLTNTQKNFKALDLSQNAALTSVDVSGCTNLADLKLPETAAIETLLLQKTAITAVDVSKYTGLKVLNVSDTKLTALDVKANTELETLALANVKVKELDVKANIALKTLDAANCGLTKIDVSANTLLEDLDVSGNSLITLDLTGLTALTKLNADNNKRNIGTVIDNTYDLTALVAEGLVVDKMTITTEGVTRNENVLTGVKGDVTYTYETGLATEGLDKVTFTLAPEKVTSENFEVSYMDGAESKSVVCETWDEVLKAMTDKNVEYSVTVKKDVTVDKLTMPTAAKAKSVTVVAEGSTITTKSASVTLPTDTLLINVKIKAVDKDGKTLAKTFTLNASKDLKIAGGLEIEAKASTIKGGAKSVLKTVHATNEFDSAITGFGTVRVDNGAVTFNNTVKVKELAVKNGSVVEIGKNAAVTVTNITSNGSTPSKLVYTDAEYKPVAVTGNITGNVKLEVGISYKKTAASEEGQEPTTTTVSRFAKDDVVLVSKNADLAAVDASESLPEGATLGRDKSDIKVMDTVATMNGVEYAQWSDITSTIAAAAKADKNFAKTAVYDITLFKELDAKGALKMPAAGTFGELYIKSDAAAQTVKFTGNLTLTGKTTFENVKLVSDSKGTAKDFTISAGKNDLTLNSVTTAEKASIKTITSSGVVNLDRVTVGTVTAATVNVTKTTSIVPGAGVINDEEKTWEGKEVAASSVTVTGNLTAKTALNLNGDNASLTVKGVVNAMSIEAEKDTATLAVYTQPKGKNALVIGKNGVTAASKSLQFVLVDYTSEKTAHITEDVVLGTIAGTYADEFVPSNDNLDTEDSYYILKSGKNLIAKSKTAAADYVNVKINGKTARYKTVDEAIKDISATGKSTDVIEITITDKTFGSAVAKLPLPTANKYKTLTYKAADAVTVKVTGDLALTGNLVLDNVDIEKVTKDGKSTAALNVNVGKYELYANGCYLNKTADAAEGSGEYSAVANISGTGKFTTGIDIVVSGKVNGTTLVLNGNKVTLDGDRAAFTGSIEATEESTFSYKLAKNVKFVNITGEGLKLDGAAVAEDAVLASITGDYTKDAVVVDGELKVVRSGNSLKAVKAEKVVEVKAYSSEAEFEEENVDKVRTYDSVASAMNDISRIKNKEACYKVAVKTGDVLVLPKANTYRGIELTADKAAEITTAKDLTLTGMLILGENVTLNKADKKAMTVKLGSYSLMIDKNAHVAYDAEKKVSQFVNIDGSKGGFFADGDITVSGKVNVGYFKAPKTTLADNASFAAAIIIAEGGDSLNYNVKNASKVKIGNILGKGDIVLNVDGEIADKQIAVLTGNYRAESVTIGDGKTYVAVPKGNKLMAVAKANAKAAALTLDGETTYLFDTYENAVKAVAKLGDAKTEIEIDVTDVQPVSGKLALPTKGKYETLTITSDKAVTLKVNSDITLTGNLVIGGKVTLQKKEGTAKDLLKFKSATDNKTKKALYTVTVVDNAKVVNGSVNGEPIVNPEPTEPEPAEKTVVNGEIGYTNETGVDLSANILKIAKTNVVENGSITVTLKDNVTSAIVLNDADGNELTKAIPDTGASSVIFILTADQAEKITANGFTVTGDAGVVTAVKYAPPSIPATEKKGETFGTLDYSGSVDLTLYVLKINAKSDVAAKGTITVTLQEAVENSIEFRRAADGDALKTIAPTSGSNTYTWELSDEDATYIQQNGFYICGTAGVITSVTYTEPTAPTTPEAKGAYEGSLNYNGDGIDLSRFVLYINKKAVVEKGTITVTLKEEVTSSVIFKKTNKTDVIKTVAPTSGSTSTTYTWVLSADDAAYIAENGFIIDGTEGVLTSVTYTAPDSSDIDDNGSDDV